MVLILSNYGFFSTGFTPETCQHYYLVAPVFKGWSSSYLQPEDSIDYAAVLQIMVSQVILGVRYVLSVFVRYGLYKVMHHVGHSTLQKEIGA
jgi:hypothetical protein